MTNRTYSKKFHFQSKQPILFIGHRCLTNRTYSFSPRTSDQALYWACTYVRGEKKAGEEREKRERGEKREKGKERRKIK